MKCKLVQQLIVYLRSIRINSNKNKHAPGSGPQFDRSLWFQSQTKYVSHRDSDLGFTSQVETTKKKKVLSFWS